MTSAHGEACGETTHRQHVATHLKDERRTRGALAGALEFRKIERVDREDVAMIPVPFWRTGPTVAVLAEITVATAPAAWRCAASRAGIELRDRRRDIEHQPVPVAA